MSINWVMLNPQGSSFIRLQSESILYTSPVRTSLTLHSLNKYPGRDPYNLTCPTGTLYLTNKRIVYLPSSPSLATVPKPQSQTSVYSVGTLSSPSGSAISNPNTTYAAPPQAPFLSFACPLLNLHDSHVTSPWFGPNEWVALVQPVANGGIPSHHAALEARVTFRDGGSFEFHSGFVRVRERLGQVLEERGVNGQMGDEVHLDQLPAYEEGGAATDNARGTVRVEQEQSAMRATAAVAEQNRTRTNESGGVPDEPPPGYEETQSNGLAESIDRAIRSRST